MNRKRAWIALLPALLLVAVVLAQSGAYDLSWWTVDNGGETYMLGGRFRLGGTMGQPDAGYLSGGRFGLLGGWWGGRYAPPMLSAIFLPVMFKGHMVAPDLVVESLQATANNVTLVLRNIGDGPVVDEFWVDVYLNPSPPPTHVNQPWTDLSAEGLVWGVVSTTLPLMPGQALVLTVGDPYFWPSYSYLDWPIEVGTPVYAQADSYNMATTYGAVLEGHEITGASYNNILGPVYALPGLMGEPPAWGNDPPSSWGLPPRP